MNKQKHKLQLTVFNIPLPQKVEFNLHLLSPTTKKTLDIPLEIEFIEVDSINELLGVGLNGNPQSGIIHKYFYILFSELNEITSLKDVCDVAVQKWFSQVVSQKWFPQVTSFSNDWEFNFIDEIHILKE